VDGAYDIVRNRLGYHYPEYNYGIPVSSWCYVSKAEALACSEGFRLAKMDQAVDGVGH
jgi:hypothetical protein